MLGSVSDSALKLLLSASQATQEHMPKGFSFQGCPQPAEQYRFNVVLREKSSKASIFYFFFLVFKLY